MAQALLVTRDGDEVRRELRELPDAELGEGDTLVELAYSSLNFKDGLALDGSRGVMRVDPLVPGIDAVGRVLESSGGRWQPGDEVVLTGAGLGETRHGGYADRARLDGGLLVRVPAELGMRRAAALGTAGVTAALSVLALERHGIPDGPVLVTGATGGVGTLAVALLARAGREVVAATGSPDQSGLLERLGASSLLDRAELAERGKPLQRARWSGAVDSIGGIPLANVLAQTVPGGAVAACGLVGGAELPTSVHPFILRGVSLLGIHSVELPLAAREEVWTRLARDIDPTLLDALTTEVPLAEVEDAGARILRGATTGRVVVGIGGAAVAD
ncbi:MDR family oxidoreductase [Homoserinibacter sp. YIM 151385]|uniref:MDR family oxidoreductase n=1 Tax=Homoserinibacter sp. YIM 151385 TaxID=2985506 RepID=UPI0022F04A09|nr:MDR family oxidoreductase [Homoserinibacter sp. YIM 151385]WBU37173.1 oxidoreductase [Homoserinibacter sp. YIM 151385]